MNLVPFDSPFARGVNPTCHSERSAMATFYAFGLVDSSKKDLDPNFTVVPSKTNSPRCQSLRCFRGMHIGMTPETDPRGDRLESHLLVGFLGRNLKFDHIFPNHQICHEKPFVFGQDFVSPYPRSQRFHIYQITVPTPVSRKFSAISPSWKNGKF